MGNIGNTSGEGHAACGDYAAAGLTLLLVPFFASRCIDNRCSLWPAVDRFCAPFPMHSARRPRQKQGGSHALHPADL
jgi:hypothetical protein